MIASLLLATSAADEPARCSSWATAGECMRNPAFMNQHCKAACAAAAKPSQQECVGWATHGECVANPQFMREQCAEQCTCAARASVGECERLAVTASECAEACEKHAEETKARLAAARAE